MSVGGIPIIVNLMNNILHYFFVIPEKKLKGSMA